MFKWAIIRLWWSFHVEVGHNHVMMMFSCWSELLLWYDEFFMLKWVIIMLWGSVYGMGYHQDIMKFSCCFITICYANKTWWEVSRWDDVKIMLVFLPAIMVFVLIMWCNWECFWKWIFVFSRIYLCCGQDVWQRTLLFYIFSQ